MTDKIVEQYYSSVDKNLIQNLCKDNNLKNLINLSTVSELYIFNKKNKKWTLKTKNKLLEECNNIKKKEIKLSSTMLSNLAKLNTTNSVNVNNIYNNLQNKINNIEKIIICIKNIEPCEKVLTFSQATIECQKHSIEPCLQKGNQVTIEPSSETILIKPKKKFDINDFNNFIECYSNC